MDFSQLFFTRKRFVPKDADCQKRTQSLLSGVEFKLDNKQDHKKGRASFWGLIGSMIVLTVGSMYGAHKNAVELPALHNFSLAAFFPSLEAKAALAQGDLIQRTISANSLGALSSLLPDVPEYEQSGLLLDEVVPDEDPLDGGRILVLPAPEAEQTFTEPLAVHNPYTSLSLADVDRLKNEDVTLEKMLGEEEDGDDDSDERPWIEHKVGQGERLADISRKYGILVATISKANSISNPNKLALGQVLLIPRTEDLLDDVLEEQKSRLEEKQAAKQKVEPVKYKRYVVKPGDSLWMIASANNLSIDSLYGTNILRNPDRLAPGTELRIPNQDGLSVKAAAGQTVAALAKKYSVPEKAIRTANGLGEKTAIRAGQELFIPGASKTLVAIRNSASGGGVSKKAPPVAKPVAGVSGRFSWPVVGKVTSPFGWRRHPIKRTQIFHAGIDVGLPRYTPIRAAKGGQVIFAGWMNGYGRTVIIRHDSVYTTLYGHAQSLSVEKGQNVKKGQVIATVGSSGRATGPHCHFEVRINDRPTNPMNYLR